VGSNEVSRRPLTAEARVQSRASPRCGGQSDNETGFSPSTLVLPCQYHSTSAPCSLILILPTVMPNHRNWQRR
jgi:hypothetical protein